VALLQILFLLQEFAPNFFSEYPEGIDQVSRFYRLIIYTVLGIIVLIEIRNLAEFHIDKFTIATFLLSSFLRQRAGIIGEELFLIFIASIGISIILALIVIKPKILETNFKWALTGLAIGLLVIFAMTLIELFLRDPWQLAPLFRGNLSTTVFSHIVRQFSLGALTEEILFRGFLWGYLRRRHWTDNQVCWAQGLLFWLLHFSRIVTPFTFLLTIPLLTFGTTILTFRTRQVFPAILFHTIINVVSALLNLATY
jgi:membrane protease YdiL (CAAX protease family)